MTRAVKRRLLQNSDMSVVISTPIKRKPACEHFHLRHKLLNVNPHWSPRSHSSHTTDGQHRIRDIINGLDKALKLQCA
jgi:hypothetical protein